jgi:ribosomal protein S18 acetylase RimI-like enzyme
MSISFAEVHHPNGFINRELRAIARLSSKSRLTTWYCVRRNSEEVVFLAVGWSDERLVPYQLIVSRELRGRGIGSAVLRALEHLAQREGYESVRL